jgi:3-hydroxyacyl-[acyl-carrier-protein] dehydratase
MASSLLVDLPSIDLDRVVMDRAKIAQILPHRHEMAMIDAICHMDVAKRLAVGRRDIRADEFWVSGHFPGNPLLPGVLCVEACAQVSLICYKAGTPEIADRLVVFGGIDRVRFRGAMKPGDRLYLIAHMLEQSRRGARAATQAVVNGKLVYEGEVLAIVT